MTDLSNMFKEWADEFFKEKISAEVMKGDAIACFQSRYPKLTLTSRVFITHLKLWCESKNMELETRIMRVIENKTVEFFSIRPTSSRLPDSEVKVKIGQCRNCKNYVRVAVEHTMDEKSKKQFYKEAAKYDLDVSSISLIKFRKDEKSFCTCKTSK